MNNSLLRNSSHRTITGKTGLAGACDSALGEPALSSTGLERPFFCHIRVRGLQVLVCDKELAYLPLGSPGFSLLHSEKIIWSEKKATQGGINLSRLQKQGRTQYNREPGNND